MTDNDYIAEYIREKYPSLLGFDFGLWKCVHIVGNALKDFANVLSEHSEEVDTDEASN